MWARTPEGRGGASEAGGMPTQRCKAGDKRQPGAEITVR